MEHGRLVNSEACWNGFPKSRRTTATLVKWALRLKPGSKVRICVLAFNPALQDSHATCATILVPR